MRSQYRKTVVVIQQESQTSFGFVLPQLTKARGLYSTPLNDSIVLLGSCGELSMSGAVSYLLLLGLAYGAALGLFFGLRAVKLI